MGKIAAGEEVALAELYGQFAPILLGMALKRVLKAPRKLGYRRFDQRRALSAQKKRPPHRGAAASKVALQESCYRSSCLSLLGYLGAQR
jgi:hypothetical protein